MKIIVALFIVTLFANNVFAQTGAELATRHELLDQAMVARDQNDHPRALDLAERAGQIRMTASVRYFIAEEQSALSLVTDALASAETCVREVDREPPSRNRTAVEANCRRLVEQLRARTGFIVVLPNVPPNATVIVEGHPLPMHLWGVPYVVSAGRVVIDVTAEGYQPYHEETLVPPGRTTNVELRMTPVVTPQVVVTPPPVPHVEPPPVAHPVVTPPVISRRAPPILAPRTRTTRSPLGLVVGSFGVAGLITALVTGLYANSLYDDFRAQCVSVQRCPDRTVAPDNLRTMDTIANVSLISGGALLATGAVMYLTIRRTETLPPAVPRIAFNPMAHDVALLWNF